MKQAQDTAVSRAALWVGLLITVGSVVFASVDHLAQYQRWATGQQQLSVQPPVMATLDAYYSLRWAQQARSGVFEAHARDPLRVYQRQQYPPEVAYWSRWSSTPEWLPQLQPKTLPPLSGLLAFSSRFFGGDVDRAGMVLPPLLSSLFFLPVFLYCWRLGHSAAGIMAGLVASFSHAYYARAGAGWVDTDCLNLFFPWLIALLILYAGAARQRRARLWFALAAGLGMHAWYLWYPKPSLAIFFMIALLAYLYFQRLGWREMLLSAGLFALAANPLQFVSGVGNFSHLAQRYLGAGTLNTTPDELGFPGVMSTVSEVQELAWNEVLGQVLGSADVGLLGLAGFALFAIQCWRRLIPLLPLLSIGLLSFVSSQRFIMYLAPFVGLGLGYLVILAVRGLLSTVNAEKRPVLTQPWFQETVASAAVVTLFALWLAQYSALGTAYRPAVPVAVKSALDTLGQQLPAGSRVWTWWDTGFMISHASSLAVFHDGGAQYTPLTYFVARSFVVERPDDLANTIRFIDARGNRGIEELLAESGSRQKLVEAIGRGPWPQQHPNIHVLFTADMISKYFSIHHLGSWNFRSGAQPKSGYGALNCDRRNANLLYCGDETIDLNEGTFHSGQVLGRVVLIEDGRVVQALEFPENHAGHTLQLLMRNRQPYAVYLLADTVYRSNFNQMYMLGRYDSQLFEEVYNDFPAARVFRLREAAD